MRDGPKQPTGGTGIVLLLVLLLAVALLAIWGWSSNPPTTPAPAATSKPTVLSPGAAPPAR
jgi:hypothetical protein